MIIYSTILAKTVNYIYRAYYLQEYYENNTQTYCLHMAGKCVWEKRLVRIIGLTN